MKGKSANKLENHPITVNRAGPELPQDLLKAQPALDCLARGERVDNRLLRTVEIVAPQAWETFQIATAHFVHSQKPIVMNMSLSCRRHYLTMSIIASLTLACALAPRSAWPQQPPAEAHHPAPRRTAPITRGELRLTVRATGTVEPEKVVDVNAQVSGIVKSFGPDPRGATDPKFKDKTVDYNTPVEEGTVLAQIDDSAYVAAVDSAKADLRVTQAELDLDKAKAELAGNNWQRAEELVKTNAISTTEVDAANSSRRTAEANQKVAEAKLAKSDANVASAKPEPRSCPHANPLAYQGHRYRSPHERRSSGWPQSHQPQLVSHRSQSEEAGDLGLGQRSRHRPDSRRSDGPLQGRCVSWQELYGPRVRSPSERDE